MSETPLEPAAVVTHCPYCGHPLGSFFGNRLTVGHWCDRCQTAFAVTALDDPGETEGGPAGNAGGGRTFPSIDDYASGEGAT